MPAIKSWLDFIFLNIGFFILLISIFYSVAIDDVKKNWPIYRCNPTYMFLADDIPENFNYCIQNTTKSLMGHMLQPLTFITSTLGATMGSFVEQINSTRGMINKIRTFIPNVFDNIFGSFAVMIIEFQKISIGIKDIMGKTTGLMVTIMHILDGSTKTVTSGFNFIKGIGKCFHPDTLIELKSGEIKKMQNLNLGDILKDGSTVESVMKIDNKKNKIPFYALNCAGTNGENIYVTGSHYVYDTEQLKFIRIENYKRAELSKVETEWFSCLITDSHKIPIGNELFWDWEDYIIRYNQI